MNIATRLNFAVLDTRYIIKIFVYDLLVIYPKIINKDFNNTRLNVVLFSTIITFLIIICLRLLFIGFMIICVLQKEKKLYILFILYYRPINKKVINQIFIEIF